MHDGLGGTTSPRDIAPKALRPARAGTPSLRHEAVDGRAWFVRPVTAAGPRLPDWWCAPRIDSGANLSTPVGPSMMRSGQAVPRRRQRLD